MKLLVIKLSSLGDVVHTFALVNRLHHERPDIKIDWLVNDSYAELVESHEAVNRVWKFRRKAWGRNWWSPLTHFGIVSLISSIRKERYDVCLDLQGLLRSGLLTFFAGAGKRAGLSSGREGSVHCYDTLIDPGEDPHAVDILLRGLKVFDTARPKTPSFGLKVMDGARAAVGKVLSDIGIKGRYLVFHPGARWQTKRWPVERWRELAERVSHGSGLPILFTGSPDDATLIDGIVKGNPKSFGLAGKVELVELASLLNDAVLMVSVDSGPMHLAAALSKPIVAIFGPTSPERTGPLSVGGVEILQAGTECVPCFSRQCERDLECMSGISAESVEARVMKTLKKLKVPYDEVGRNR